MATLNLRGHQNDSIDLLRDGFAQGHSAQMLYLPCGGGKCHGIDTPILMADGSIKMVQDVVVGDKLIGPDGSIKNVLALGRGNEEMYRVIPLKGDPYTCNKSHILSLQVRGGEVTAKLADGRSVRQSDGVIAIDVQSYIDSNNTSRARLKGWRSPAIEFDSCKGALPIPPYILGAWLGDGDSARPSISKPPCKMTEQWRIYAESVGLTIKIDFRGDSCPSFHATGGMRGGWIENPITHHLRALNLIKNKHIPQSYKTASIQDRLQLLAGLLDTDGYHAKGGYNFGSKYEVLANDFAFVARSVGLTCIVKKIRKHLVATGYSGWYWSCSVSGDCSIIPALDKPADALKINKMPRIHGISIEPIGAGDYYGFQLDGDHLYLLGDFTVCHNTEIAVAMMDASQKKHKRNAMLVDLTLLCAQTSARLQRYDIDHGVIQPKSPRYRPELPIQVCMIQTLEARGDFPSVDLLVVDEAHTLRASVLEFIRNNPKVKVVGLSGSPFTKGLGSVYTNVVSPITINQLTRDGFLINPRIFIAKQIDMSGAKKVAGEWSDKEATERGIKITGDVVAEWIAKTHDVFGEPKKTIVFCSGVAHGNDLAQKFSEAGYNFICVSYKDDEDYKRQVLKDFSRPDTEINGLIATDLLTKGFDVTDVCIGVSARPFSKSFSAHVQQLGRIMRPHDAKDQAIWLDHSGNYLRFREDWDDLCENGVSELEDGKEKTKPEPTDKEKEASKCPACGHLWGATDTCPHCGHVRVRRNDVMSIAGEMTELSLVPKKEKYSAEYKADFYAQLLGYARDKGHAPGSAYHRYIEKFKVGPSMAKPAAKDPGPEVLNWIKSRHIAYAHRKKAA